MRIISGSAKGTKLVGLKDLSIRPTLDRVRESFFNQINADIRGSGFLDLFAGSGAVGIEALSRGAENVIFVEKDSGARRLILNNLEKCRFGNDEQPDCKWNLIKSSAHEAILSLDKAGNKFDIVYVDPPFADDLYSSILLSLSSSNLLLESSQIIVEHDRKTDLEESYDKLIQIKSRRMGDSCLTFYSPK
ncbi:MAG: 16S rRNA (guanine(966)-N(2))-methyltransferase RsmD [Nitrospinales bacterium]